MTRQAVVLAAALLLSAARGAAAQDTGTHPAAERGDRSILVRAGGDVAVGYWWRHSERTDWGIEVGTAADYSSLDGQSSTDVGVVLTPGVKHYLVSDRPLAPFSYFALPLSYLHQSADFGAPGKVSRDVLQGGVDVGLGLDWFPIARVGIGGIVGVGASARYISEHTVDANFPGPGMVDRNGYGLHLNTFTSGLRVQFYF